MPCTLFGRDYIRNREHPEASGKVQRRDKRKQTEYIARSYNQNYFL